MAFGFLFYIKEKIPIVWQKTKQKCCLNAYRLITDNLVPVSFHVLPLYGTDQCILSHLLCDSPIGFLYRFIHCGKNARYQWGILPVESAERLWFLLIISIVKNGWKTYKAVHTPLYKSLTLEAPRDIAIFFGHSGWRHGDTETMIPTNTWKKTDLFFNQHYACRWPSTVRCWAIDRQSDDSVPVPCMCVTSAWWVKWWLPHIFMASYRWIFNNKNHSTVTYADNKPMRNYCFVNKDPCLLSRPGTVAGGPRVVGQGKSHKTQKTVMNYRNANDFRTCHSIINIWRPIQKMAAILQTTFSYSFSCMTFVLFWFNSHWNLFPIMQSKTTQHWFR